MPPRIRGLIGIAVFLVLWEVGCRVSLIDARFVPPPSEVLSGAVRLFADQAFRADFIATVLAWLIAVLVSIGIAVPAGLVLGSVPLVRTATSAVVEFLRPIPPVSLIPVALIALGEGAQTKIALAAFAGVWPIMFNVMYGLREVDPLFVDTARAFRVGRLRTTLAVRLPYVAPFAFTGIRLSFAVTLVVIVSTEFLTTSGLGFGSYIQEFGQQVGDNVVVFAGAVIAGGYGYLVNFGLQSVQDRWLGWTDWERAR